MDYYTNDLELTSVADEIRNKGGTSLPLSWPDGFISAIEDFRTSPVSTTTIDDIAEGKTRELFLEEASYVYRSIFSYWHYIQKVTGLNAKYVGESAFTSCYGLTEVSFPLCSEIFSYAFSNCTVLSSAVFPVCNHIYNSVFYNCTSLKEISFPSCERIDAYAFNRCIALSQIYLLGPSVVILSYSAFVSTPIVNSSFLGYFGSIYVPASLAESYRAAVDWSSYVDRIVGI